MFAVTVRNCKLGIQFDIVSVRDFLCMTVYISLKYTFGICAILYWRTLNGKKALMQDFRLKLQILLLSPVEETKNLGLRCLALFSVPTVLCKCSENLLETV